MWLIVAQHPVTGEIKYYVSDASDLIEAAIKLGLVEIARIQRIRFDGLKPFAFGLGHGWLIGCDSYQIHQVRPPTGEPGLRSSGTNAPEGFVGRTVTTEGCAAAGQEHSTPLSQIDVGKQIRVRAATVVIQG